MDDGKKAVTPGKFLGFLTSARIATNFGGFENRAGGKKDEKHESGEDGK